MTLKKIGRRKSLVFGFAMTKLRLERIILDVVFGEKTGLAVQMRRNLSTVGFREITRKNAFNLLTDIVRVDPFLGALSWWTKLIEISWEAIWIFLRPAQKSLTSPPPCARLSDVTKTAPISHREPGPADVDIKLQFDERRAERMGIP